MMAVRKIATLGGIPASVRLSDTQPKMNAERLLEIVELQRSIIATELRVSSVCELVMERASRLLRAGGVTLELFEDDTLVVTASKGLFEEFVDMRVPLQGTFSCQAATSGRVLRSDCVMEDDRIASKEWCKQLGIVSIMAAPLEHRAIVIGILKVVSDKRDAFSHEDEMTLRLLAGVVASHLCHAHAYEEQERKAHMDLLTDLPNRRAFEGSLDAVLEREANLPKPRSTWVGIVDVDHFKRVNDTYGHPMGDAVLRGVADTIRNCVRSTDMVARWGGEEFVFLIEAANSFEAASIAERIRHEVAEATLVVSVTVSVGMTSVRASDSKADVMTRADRCLYQAKETGRNRVCRAV